MSNEHYTSAPDKSPSGDARKSAPPIPPRADDIELPVGTTPLLDAQLGEALKIMRDYATWIHSPNSRIEHCVEVGDAMGRLMNASATLAGVSARLRVGEPETRHRMIVEYAAPAAANPPSQGEGGAQNRKTNKPAP